MSPVKQSNDPDTKEPISEEGSPPPRMSAEQEAEIRLFCEHHRGTRLDLMLQEIDALRAELAASSEGIPGWLAELGSGVLGIGDRSGWREAVGVQENGKHGLYFAFVTLRDGQARNAAALLGAAGLLCETATRNDTAIEAMLPHGNLWYAQTVASVVDGLRALGGAPSEKPPVQP